MKTFIKNEVWEDNWCFTLSDELHLPGLEILDYCTWFKNKRNKIEVQLDSHKDSIEPTKNQIRIFEYILRNQNIIRHSIFEYYQNVVLPIYKMAINISEDDIAGSIDQLSKVLGLRTIEIPEFHYPETFYYLFQFDFRYDDEHGLYLLFENSKVIDLFGEGEKNFDAVELYQRGMKDKSNEPIKYSICELNGKKVIEGNSYYDESITFELKKGTYRAYTICNSTSRVRNFYVSENLECFTLEQLLTMKEKNVT